MDYITRIDAADVYEDAIVTPLVPAPALSARIGNTVLMKREDLQPTHAFKIRGAANKVASLSPSDQSRGVVCSSAGNHAQGVARAAQRRGIEAHIVMPEATPSIKVDAVKSLGGNVILHGRNYDEAQELAYEIADTKELCLIHPFDDPDVIAGQGTIGKEILEQCSDLDAVFIAVGGGGLAAGVASYIRAKRPDATLIGVEPVDSASMRAAFDAGTPVELDEVGIFAESVATKKVGAETFRLCYQLLDDVITVSTDEICAAIKDVFETTRSLVEPAGALALAGLKSYASEQNWSDQTVIAINCGANMNFERLRYISERTATGMKTEALLAVEIPEEKGSFLKFCQAIGNRHVTEFNYRFVDSDVARIFVGLELLSGESGLRGVIDELERHGYAVENLTSNELAKTHVRHMIGGGPSIPDEKLFRFAFPERRGALLKFLEAVGNDWNISLFHYRNYGSDFGRVLVGVVVTEESMESFEEHLHQLGYRYWNETLNPAYRLFLRSPTARS